MRAGGEHVGRAKKRSLERGGAGAERWNRVADDLGKGFNRFPLEVDSVVPYAVLGATNLIAWLSYRWLETPLIRWSHRVTGPPVRG